jgi:hypothetical protein
MSACVCALRALDANTSLKMKNTDDPNLLSFARRGSFSCSFHDPQGEAM